MREKVGELRPERKGTSAKEEDRTQGARSVPRGVVPAVARHMSAAEQVG